MVATRSGGVYSISGNARHDGVQSPHDHNHNRDTNAVVCRDTARVAADRRTSTRSRGMKIDRALQPRISTEDKPERTRTRLAVSNQATTRQLDSRKSSRGTKPQGAVRARATNKGRGSKTKANLERPAGADDGQSKENNARAPGKKGTKRKREDEDEDEEERPGSEVDSRHPKTSVKRIRSETGSQVDHARCRSAISPGGQNGPSSSQGPRRSARLASKYSVLATQNRSRSAEEGNCVIRGSTQARRKCARGREDCENEGEGVILRGVERDTSVAAVKVEDAEECSSGSETKSESSEGTLVANSSNAVNVARAEDNEEGTSSSVLVKKEEEEDLTWLVEISERDGSVDSFTSATDQAGLRSRSSSVESVLTPPPFPRARAGNPLVHYEYDPLIPLETIPEETDREIMHRAYLGRFLAGRLDEEESEDDDDRDRSLAPEPEEGLFEAMQLGRIRGLGSPERLVEEWE